MNNVVPGVLGKVSGGIHQLTVRAVQQGDPASPVVLVLPAMGVPASYYRPFVQRLYEQGNTVVTVDQRGHGEAAPKPVRGVRCGYRDLVDDVGSVLDLIVSVYPHAPRFLLGHSIGGQVSMLYAAADPGRVQGLVLLASGSVWFRCFGGTRGVRYLIGIQLAVIAMILGYWPGHRLGFGGASRPV